MPAMGDLRAQALGLLQGRASGPEQLAGTRFSPFRREQVAEAMELARRFSQTAAGKPPEVGIAAVLDEARALMSSELPAIVKYALLIFLTHDENGARLGVPGLEERHPAAVVSMVAAQEASEDPLAYFREDILANEHHQHWHLVYVSDPEEQPQEKERQGELFLYMHEQMLARYDTERLAAGQPLVAPLKPTEPLAEGYDPHWPDEGYGPRKPGARLPAKQAKHLQDSSAAFLDAASNGGFEQRIKQGGNFRTTGPQPALDLLGSTIESHADRDDSFPGKNVHNTGHGNIGEIEGPDKAPGVMVDTATAIRDPIFWRWHRLIDDPSFQWQERQGPRDHTRAPDKPPSIKIRPGDLLVATAKDLAAAGVQNFHDERSGEATVQGIFAQAAWDKSFEGVAPTTGQLATQIATRSWKPTIGRERPGEGREWPAQDIRYLDMVDEFAYLIRLENTAKTQTEITVRLFLAATELAGNRRMWIELDKFLRTLGPAERRVVYRPSSLSSVVRKPAQRPPGPPPVEQHDKLFNYCQCGWPYNLLLPRGTTPGMPFKLMAMITDAGYDNLAEETDCGGMSFCGVRDSYPDARNMGYPFDRPFDGGDALAGIGALPNVAVRDLTIKSS